MLKVNFVPDDYIQSNESRRTNFMYVILFALVMVGLSGAFAVIKIQQHRVSVEEKAVNERVEKAQEDIKQYEQLQSKKKEMMKTVLTTGELQESIQRSVLLASITNNLPVGTSLVNLELKQEKPKNLPNQRKSVPAANKFQKANQKNQQKAAEPVSPEKLLITNISIEGITPSDLQVAAFIENLGCSPLLEDVALVESKEQKNKKDDTKYRQFKLTARLRKEIHVTQEDIDRIREKCKKRTYRF